MFFAPFLIMLGVKKYISWFSLLIVPLVYLFSLFSSWMAGRSLKSLLSIYLNQAGTFKDLTLNAPNLYVWISNQFYSMVVPLGALLTVTVIVYLVYIIYKSHLKITIPVMIQLALISVLVVPYLLPKMHERYFFAADVISIIFGFYYPRYFFVPIIINLVSLFSYFPYLMLQHGVGVQIFSLPILSLILGLTILITLYHLRQTLQEAEQQKLL
jgi:Gpi18-like mannosyltransferase